MTDTAPASASASTEGQIETRKDLDKGPAGIWAYWQIQEAIAEKAERDWLKQAGKIIRRYRDERSRKNLEDHLMNIFWSNVQTLKPALYGRMPKADCERRWKDQDDVGRLAAMLLERSLDYSLDNCGFDDAMRASVEDLLLPGRGALRILYVPHYGDALPKPDDGTAGNEEGAAELVASKGDARSPAAPPAREEGPPAAPQTPQDSAPSSDSQPEPATATASPSGQPPQAEREVVWEEVRFKYVAWGDYREGPARQWDEVPWLRYKSYMTRAELRARFGKATGDKVSLDYTPKGSEEEADKQGAAPDAYKKAIVHEYWDKTKKEVVWIAPGTPDVVLDQLPDPLEVRGFFPQPAPLLATTTTDRRIPVPDYHLYRDQAEALDTLTTRIDRLTRALRVFGIYPGEEKGTLSQILNGDESQILIPVAEWQGIVDKGGMEGMIQWFPVKEIAEALIQLYNARDRAKQVLYEITGIADIIRGATDPDETLGAQQLKGQFATLRLSDRQKGVARFARDSIRIAADVIGRLFSAKTLSLMTGYPQLLPVPALPAPPVMPPEVQAELQQAQAMSQQQPAVQQSMPGMPPQAPPQPPPPSPAAQQYMQSMQAWQQQQQQQAQVQAENARRQAEFEAAVELIKVDVINDFRIDIEADSTITVDEQAEKAARTEFLEQMVPMLETVIPFAQGVPPMASLCKEIVLFGVRAFKTGRSLEDTIEAAFDALASMQPHPDGPLGQKDQKPDNNAGQQAMAQAKMHDTDVTAAAESKGDMLDFLVKMQTNALKQREIEGNLAIKDRQLAETARSNVVKQAMEHDRNVADADFKSTRALNISARGAAGLT